MATLESLVERVRLELGDLGQSFVSQFMADGTTNRFQLQYNPIDAAKCRVFQSTTEITDNASVEESTGTLVLDFLPADGQEFTVSGIYYRYFTDRELNTIVSTALLQHVGRKTDTFGREITLDNLPSLEEYPVALYATTLALYTLATDASFDINIFAPDGVSIPRSERYRQLMEMIDSRREQYRELCVQLGIGMYTIEVFSLRRVSKTTNRYVPVYKPMEVDDRSMPQRVDLELPTYGDKVTPWPSAAEELTAYEGFEFTYTKTFTGDYTGKFFEANILTQRGSNYIVRNLNPVLSSSTLTRVLEVSRTASEDVALFTVDIDHGMEAGDLVFIAGVTDELNGTWTVATVPTTDSFTITTTETTEVAITEPTGTADPYGEKTYTVTFSLTPDNTRRLPRRTYWSLAYKEDLDVVESIELYGGNFFTERASEVVL